jgi:hypothetical protein
MCLLLMMGKSLFRLIVWMGLLREINVDMGTIGIYLFSNFLRLQKNRKYNQCRIADSKEINSQRKLER